MMTNDVDNRKKDGDTIAQFDKEMLKLYCGYLRYNFIFLVFLMATLIIFLIALHIAIQIAGANPQNSFIARTIMDFRVPLLLFVFLSGALGAFISSLSRLFSLEQLPQALKLTVDFEPGHMLMYSLIRPITGAVFAVLFYLIMASGLISSPLFVSFDCLHQEKIKCQSLVGLFAYAPKEVTDYAKALVWAFFSGFFERLVPDAIASIASKEAKTRDYIYTP